MFLAPIRCESKGCLKDRVAAGRETSMYAPHTQRHFVSDPSPGPSRPPFPSTPWRPGAALQPAPGPAPETGTVGCGGSMPTISYSGFDLCSYPRVIGSGGPMPPLPNKKEMAEMFGITSNQGLDTHYFVLRFLVLSPPFCLTPCDGRFAADSGHYRNLPPQFSGFSTRPMSASSRIADPLRGRLHGRVHGILYCFLHLFSGGEITSVKRRGDISLPPSTKPTPPIRWQH